MSLSSDSKNLNDSSSSNPLTANPANLAHLTHRVSLLTDSLAKKDRQFDLLLISKDRQVDYIKTLHAHNMLRQHIRSCRTKRLLMSLHLTSMEMIECLKLEETRRINHSEGKVYDSQSQPSKNTLRKLASLYRKRPMLITSELDDLLTHEIKMKFFDFMNNYQSISKENESLFTRNVALTKDMIFYKEQSEKDKIKAEEYSLKLNEKNDLFEASQREVENLKKQIANMAKDEEIRKRKENAKNLQAKTQEYSKSFANAKLTAEIITNGISDESKEMDSPKSPKISALAISLKKSMLNQGNILPSLPSPTSQSHSLAQSQQLLNSSRSPLARQNTRTNNARRTTAQAALNITIDNENLSSYSKSEVASPNTANSINSPLSPNNGLPALISPTNRSSKRATAR